ncbi:MAG: hypothetical protein IPJ74_03635 [Saprospiraceae bacterium]|nr:hypothetical protein [Saprospiraceae bacterium]
MKLQPLLAFLMMIALFTLPSCGGASKEKEDDNDTTSTIESEEDGEKSTVTIETDDPMEATKEALRQLSAGDVDAKEVVSYQSLKDLMPNSLLGMKRTNIEGQKSGMQGLSISTATAEYEEGEKELDVSIVDAGGSTLTLAGLAMWANMEFERESDDGYERTTKIDGHKAFEQYDKKNKSGQLSVLVDNRFVVNIEGENISENDLRKALNDISLRKISRLQ